MRHFIYLPQRLFIPLVLLSMSMHLQAQDSFILEGVKISKTEYLYPEMQRSIAFARDSRVDSSSNYTVIDSVYIILQLLTDSTLLISKKIGTHSSCSIWNKESNTFSRCVDTKKAPTIVIQNFIPSLQHLIMDCITESNLDSLPYVRDYYMHKDTTIINADILPVNENSHHIIKHIKKNGMLDEFVIESNGIEVHGLAALDYKINQQIHLRFKVDP